MRVRRKARRGEYVCTCRAYPFPHRFTGGRCTLLAWVRRFWSREPHGSACQECHCYGFGECQVNDGIEDAIECVAIIDFIALEEITVPLRYRKHERRKVLQPRASQKHSRK